MNKTLKIILIVFAVFFLLCICSSVAGYFLVKSGTIDLPNNPVFNFISDPTGELSEEAGEELAEDLIEGSTGEDVDIEIDADDESISMETEDGSYYAGSTDKWPSDAPSNVPEYESGNINFASKTDSDTNTTWSIIIESVSESSFDNYKEELETNGFSIDGDYSYNEIRTITALKDKISLYVDLDKSENNLTMTIFLEK